jgi:hypothetical protein
MEEQTIYLLTGEIPVREYFDGGVDAVLKNCEGEYWIDAIEIHPNTKNLMIVQLTINVMRGCFDACVITEEEFNQLKQQ